MLERAEDMHCNVKMTCLEMLISASHLLRKIEKAINFPEVYDMVKCLYCQDDGRPAVDPVVLVKMVLLQHLYGIKSLRQTVREVDMNIAYRWFIGYDIDTPIPHFATISYAFAIRFPSDVFEQIFAWVLETAVAKGFIRAETIFIDATHIKANANRKKQRKELVQKAARVYDERLREEINADRIVHNKKPLKEKDNYSESKEVTTSTTDPDCSLFHKGEHKVEFAYTAHVGCDKNNFVLACEVTPGNVHDSMVFDVVYEAVADTFNEVETVAVDAGYKTPWICKKVQEDMRNLSTAYKRPMSKQGFFRSYEYVYDEYFDCVICPNNQILRYTNTNRDGYREFKSSRKYALVVPFCTNALRAAIIKR